MQVSLILLNISGLAKPLRLYVTKECYRRQRETYHNVQTFMAQPGRQIPCTRCRVAGL